MKARSFARNASSLVISAMVVLSVAGCLDRNLKPVTPCVSQGFVTSIEQQGVDKVDLLFMVDDSGSMRPEQQILATNFPRMIQILVTGDRMLNDVAGHPETMTDNFPPVKDLHLGVVTCDMGTAGYAIPGCNHQPYGDDGVLRTAGDTSTSGCMASYPHFLSYPNGSESPTAFAMDFACVAKVGTSGCGFEQQLESPLKALTPATSPIRFFNNTTGHGDDPATNNGFLRSDSIVAIVVITDEESSDVQNPNIFNPADPGVMQAMANGVSLNIIGHFPPTDSYLYPTDRYVNGFQALRPNNPDLVIFAGITGIPLDLVPSSGGENYDAILADPRMQYAISATDNSKMKPACSVTFNEPGGAMDMRSADPERRLVQVAKGFGSNGTIQSICQTDFSPALDVIVSKIADKLSNVCLPRALNPDSVGQVGCDVVEILPTAGNNPNMAPTRCQDIPGCSGGDSPNCPVEVTPLRTENGQEYCTVKQLPVMRSYDSHNNVTGVVAVGSGWYYDDFSNDTKTRCTANATPQRIAFTDNARPPTGSTVSLECLQRVETPTTSATQQVTVGIGTFCNPGNDSDQDHNPATPAVNMGCETGTSNSMSPATVFVPSANNPNYCDTAQHQCRLFCAPATRTCQLPCENSSDCPSSFVCDTSNKGSVAWGVCVNPICT